MSKYELKPEKPTYSEHMLFDLMNRVSNLEADVKMLSDNIIYVLKQISADLEDRRKLRVKQLEVIDKLNKYLQDWV